MTKDYVCELDELLHKLLFKLKLDRPGILSDALAGIVPLDLHILKIVSDNPDVMLKDIRDELEIPNSTLSSAVSRMVKKGLIERTLSRRDLRSYGLKLSKKGRRVQEEHARVDHMTAQFVLDALDDESEKKALVTLLSRIVVKAGQGSQDK